MITARTGSESHTSNWGKFVLHGIDLVAEGWERDRHHSYRDGALDAPDGIIFSIWQSNGDKRGTQEADYWIAITDKNAPAQKIEGGCYGRGGYIEGNFRILAHGDGKTRAPRLLEWVKQIGGIEKMTTEIAAQIRQFHSVSNSRSSRA